MANLSLQIENMHCGACVRRVTMTLNSLPNTHADEVSIGHASITTTTSPAEITQALTAAGYPASVTA